MTTIKRKQKPKTKPISSADLRIRLQQYRDSATDCSPAKPKLDDILPHDAGWKGWYHGAHNNPNYYPEVIKPLNVNAESLGAIPNDDLYSK